MNSLWPTPSAADMETVIEQLGRRPRGFLGVARRCRYGFPQVIVNHPVFLEGEEPHVFPTLFWLTCPYLNRLVARLESSGHVARWQQCLQEDAQLAAAMQQAHEHYAQQRREVVPDAVQSCLARSYAKHYRVLMESGVGGIRNQEGIKCLHTHLAHTLAGGPNPVGQWTAQQIPELDGCPTGRCGEERKQP